MAQVIKNVLRGLLLPDDRMEWWDDESGEFDTGGTRLGALPCGGPMPGIPDPQVETEMVLSATGSQSQNRQLRIRTQRAGFPDRDGASFLWKNEGDTDWYGWDVPNVITGWEAISWTSTGTVSKLYPHAVTLTDGTVVMVCQQGTTAGTPTLVYFRRGADGAGSGGNVYLYSTQSQDIHPCLVLLPSGRLLCYAWENDEAADLANIRMWYSDDGGVSWDTASAACLPDSIDTSSTSGAGNAGYDLKRLRAAYKDGQVLLVACLQAHDTDLSNEDILVQFASLDLGATFVEVDRHDTSAAAPREGGNYQDIVVVGGYFVLAYLDLGDDLPTVVRLSNAFEPFTASEQIAAVTTEPWGTSVDYYTDGDLCLFKDEADNLYMTGRQPGVGNEWLVVRSSDAGLTWDEMARSSATAGVGKWWDSGDSSTYPADACATFQRGRALIIHSHASNPGIYDESLSVTYLGGYTTVTMPGYEAFRSDKLQVTFSRTYLPFDLPGDCGWTASGGGSESIASGLLRATVGIGTTRWYDRTPTGTVANGVLATAILDPSVGTGEFLVRMGDAGEGYEVAVRVSPTTIQVWDEVAGTQVDSTVNFGGGEVEVRVALKGDHTRVWYRLYDTSESREWIVAADSVSLADDAGATFTSNRVRWGCPLGGVLTREIDWRFVAYVTDENSARNYVGTSLTDYTNPHDTFGRPYSTAGTYVDDNVVIKAVDGPTFAGDEWHVDTRYQHPVDHLLPTVTPSPRKAWRSGPRSGFNASTAYLHLAWRIDADGDGSYLSADSYVGNDLVALYLDGLNCAQVRVDLYYGGAWNNVTSTSVHQFNGQRKGNVVVPTSTSNFGSKYRLGEQDGAGIAFSPIGFLSTDWTGKIRHNTEGITNTNGVTTKTAAFHLLDTDGATSTSPYVTVWPRRHLIVIHPSGYSDAITGIRLRIPVSAAGAYPGVPSDGYYEIGKVAFGPVLVFGHDYSWTRTITAEANTDLTVAPDGSRRSRVRGPVGRTLEVGWAEGVDVTNWREEDAPDYLMASANAGAVPVAYRHDLPIQLQDLLRYLQGPHKLVGYIPVIEHDSNSGSSGNRVAYHTNWANGFIYGRVVSPVRIEQVLGEEEESEVYRVVGVELSEEVG